MTGDLPGLVPVPPLESISPRARDVCLAWYQAGLEDGVRLGRRQVEDEWRGAMTVSAAIARQVAAREPFAVLADRRGQPERAERQRALLRERGVTP
jgi:hypothetical protein